MTVATGSSDSRVPWIASIDLQTLRDEAASFESVAAYGSASWSPVLGADGSNVLSGRMVSPSVFTVLRATPHLGRFFVEDDARSGADRVVLLSFDAWASRFASDPDIVGTSIALDGAAHTVVGVLPDGFHFPTLAEEFWKPLVIRPPRLPSHENGLTGFTSFHAAIARLRDGVSPARAAAEASVLLARTPAVVPLRDELAREYRPALLALTWATALMLLIACINVSGLLLARGVARRQSLAICAALGAGRGRLAPDSAAWSDAAGLDGRAPSERRRETCLRQRRGRRRRTASCCEPAAPVSRSAARDNRQGEREVGHSLMPGTLRRLGLAVGTTSAPATG